MTNHRHHRHPFVTKRSFTRIKRAFFVVTMRGDDAVTIELAGQPSSPAAAHIT
jgi:hypothetical protein